ncbi:MAG: DUF4256 domain-containing protein [Planctomyces sp.]|nr:DUF4256 domain-containing protein [Planctomyces sp.]
MKKKKQTLSTTQRNEMLAVLKTRFEENMNRHAGLKWKEIQVRLETQPQKLLALSEMETTGGEPDVTGFDRTTNEIIFCDCSAESPPGRRSVCYDQQGLESRKEHRPENSAVEMAAAMGIELLTVDDYRTLQTLGTFDSKTSSWLWTPPEIRRLGGALFGDFRYGTVFVYHNGAQSYYAVRGFRGLLRVGNNSE